MNKITEIKQDAISLHIEGETFEVATFDSMEAEAQAIEGNMNLDDAISLAIKIFRDGKSYGVEVLSQSSHSQTPIKLTITKQ
ncbi:MAG: hypothetical protein V4643_10785 [Bacteroidota bacterium]